MTTPLPYPILRTQRLWLTPLVSADAHDLFAVYADAETMRHMHMPPAASVADVLAEINHILARSCARHWAIRLAEEAPAVGVIGLVGGTGPQGIGYILRRDLWGQGLISEALAAVIEFGFVSAEIDTLELWIDTDNTGSIRVAKKLGFREFARSPAQYPHRADPHEMVLMALGSAEWREKNLTQRNKE